MEIKQEKKRDSIIDIARVIVIFVIIFGHANIRTPYCGGWCPELSIATAIMGGCKNSPVIFFFLFAGYFSKRTETLIPWKRVGSLLLSTIFWGVTGYLSFHALASLGLWYRCGSFTPVVQADIFGLFGSVYSIGVPGHCDLWFMKVLIPIVFLSGMLARIPAIGLLFLAGSCYAGAEFLDYGKVTHLPYILHQKSLEAICYFCAGIVLRRYVPIQALSAFVHKISCPCFLVLFLQSGVSIFTHWNMFGLPVIGGGLLILFYLSAAALVSKIRKMGDWVAKWGVAVFFVYVIQEILVMGFRDFFEIIPINKHAYTCIPVVIMGICLLLYSILQRVLPERLKKIVFLQG